MHISACFNVNLVWIAFMIRLQSHKNFRMHYGLLEKLFEASFQQCYAYYYYYYYYYFTELNLNILCGARAVLIGNIKTSQN